MLRRAFLALLASSTVFAAPDVDLGLTPEILHGIIREVAAKNRGSLRFRASRGRKAPEAWSTPKQQACSEQTASLKC
jgi:hypothetical protein